ncbi:MAG TPA: Gfo/Idh/MocA family oxidoreductase, partial [Candidatus Andersenbacteria bacterium]|nr:Gfo/Idh/MocA family oxidoreductase [Candidatus Andersenbacteria bacterium]
EVGAQYPAARRVRDVALLLGDADIDAVSIASYDADHYSQVIQALESGKHVFAEKPLCLYEREAAHIQQLLAARPELVLSSHFPLRRTPLFRELVADAQRGVYGELYYVSADYNYGRLPKLTEGWRGQADFYSIVLGGGVHLVDLLLQLAGEDVIEVTAAGNKIVSAGSAFRFDDLVTSTIRFKGGLVATITCNFGNVSPHFTPLRVYGTKASFELGSQGARRFASRDPATGPKTIATPYRQEKQDDTTPLIHSFIGAILTGSQPAVTADQVFQALAVCFAIDEAKISGDRVPVKHAEHHPV